MKPLIAAAVLAAVAGGAAAAVYFAVPRDEQGEIACNANPIPAPGTTLSRWGDLTIMIPEGVLAYGDLDETGVPVLVIFPQEINQSYRTVIDATTGTVVAVVNDAGGLRPKEAEIQAALESVSICPLDAAAAPWPYAGEPPDGPRQTVGKLSYLEPDPATGIQVFGGGQCNGECRTFIRVSSVRSSVYVDAGNGQVIGPAKIAPEEKEAFERYLASVQVINPR